MPLRVVSHMLDSITLDCICDNDSGLILNFVTLLMASISCSTLWPFTSTTFQLNASHLSRTGSRGIISSVNPSCCILFRSRMAVKLAELEL